MPSWVDQNASSNSGEGQLITTQVGPVDAEARVSYVDGYDRLAVAATTAVRTGRQTRLERGALALGSQGGPLASAL